MRSVVITCHKLGGLNDRNVLSEFWRDQVSMRLPLTEDCEKSLPCLFPRFWWSAGNLCHFLACGISVIPWHSSCMHVCVQISPFYKDVIHNGLGPTLLQYDLILIIYAVTLWPNNVMF